MSRENNLFYRGHGSGIGSSLKDVKGNIVTSRRSSVKNFVSVFLGWGFK